MDKFVEDIKGTVFFLASSVNQLIDLAEKNGLYPKGELDILREEQKAIFKEIYNGGFSLKLDEKYNVQIQVDDFDGYVGDVETSTAQSISVIFAFIAGVIKMARENNSDERNL